MTPIIVTPPASEPLSVAEIKAALGIDGTHHDSTLLLYAKAAREKAEHATSYLCMQQTIRLECESWPDDLLIRYSPVQSVSSVQYWDGAAWVTVSSADYVAWQDGTLWRVDPVSSWPSLGVKPGPRVRVTFVGGRASANEVPSCIKQFILAQTGSWFRNPESVTSDGLSVSPHFVGLLDPVRVYG